MDRRTQLLIRNVAGGAVLLVIALLVMSWLGVFAGPESDEGQIHALIDGAKEDINNANWDRLLRLCDLTEQERAAWRERIPQQANFLRITAITPQGFISVPQGAVEYEIDVMVLAHMRVMGRELQHQRLNGTMYFVKRDDQWRIDLNRTAPTFPYVPRP